VKSRANFALSTSPLGDRTDTGNLSANCISPRIHSRATIGLFPISSKPSLECPQVPSLENWTPTASSPRSRNPDRQIGRSDFSADRFSRKRSGTDAQSRTFWELYVRSISDSLTLLGSRTLCSLGQRQRQGIDDRKGSPSRLIDENRDRAIEDCPSH
jgi:hypothetical protein